MPKDKVDKLLESSLLLQKSVVQLGMKVNKLANQIGKLLDLYTEAAEKYTGKSEIKAATKSVKERSLEQKIEMLLEQNKTIAESLLLLQQFVKENISKKGMELSDLKF